MAALAARQLSRPVKIVLSRQEDIRYTGKRHPYSADFRLGVDSEGHFLAYQVTLFVKITLAILSGAAAAVHQLGNSRAALAIGGALGMLAALGAMFFGYLLSTGT